jgi:hypothetical protein
LSIPELSPDGRSLRGISSLWWKLRYQFRPNSLHHCPYFLRDAWSPSSFETKYRRRAQARLRPEHRINASVSNRFRVSLDSLRARQGVRKATLASILRKSRPSVRLNEHLEYPEGHVVFQHAYKMGLEGIVSKRLGSRYRSGRSPYWLKFKNPDAQHSEMVKPDADCVQSAGHCSARDVCSTGARRRRLPDCWDVHGKHAVRG